MNRVRLLTYIFILCALVPSALESREIREGRIKLILHERTGRFSLYYLTDLEKERYDPLFFNQDPRTSFLAVLVDDKTFRLGESAAFRYRISTEEKRPAIIFESSFLSVTQEFSFIKTPGAPDADGIRMDVKIENRGERQTPVGVRFLLDTQLGERNPIHFSTDRRELRSETVISGVDSDGWWFSKNDTLGLMGSVSVPGIPRPDSIHFANWKRLNNTPWRVPPSPGRNFNLLPFSVGDSALCYYFDPVPLAQGGKFSVGLLLAVARDSGFGLSMVLAEEDVSHILGEGSAEASSPEHLIRIDLISLQNLLDRIDRAIAAGGTVGEEELASMEEALDRVKERHGAK